MTQQNRLLTDEEIGEALEELRIELGFTWITNCPTASKRYAIAKAQDAKTSRIVRQEVLKEMGRWLWSKTRWSAPDHSHVRYGYFSGEDMDCLIENGELPGPTERGRETLK